MASCSTAFQFENVLKSDMTLAIAMTVVRKVIYGPEMGGREASRWIFEDSKCTKRSIDETPMYQCFMRT